MFVNEQVFISCDTKFDRDLLDYYGPKSSVMFHGVQFFRGSVHAPLDDLRDLPEEMTRKMYLLHYSDDWELQQIAEFGGWAEQGASTVSELLPCFGLLGFSL